MPYHLSITHCGPVWAFKNQLRDWLPLESALADLLQHIIDRATLRLALMLVKVGLELLFGFIGVKQKFLARPEGQSTDIAKRRTRCGADETHDLEVTVCHGNIIAGLNIPVKYPLIKQIARVNRARWRTRSMNPSLVGMGSPCGS